MEYLGTYCGYVIDTKDPLMLGRMKVRVPNIHGMLDLQYQLIADVDLPWALPAGMPAGGNETSGGITWAAGVGDQVWVRFLDGQLEKPVWEWGNQNQTQAKAWGPLHNYQSNGRPADRAGLTRYGHWTEYNPDKIIHYTKNGYVFRQIDSTSGPDSGALDWITAKGAFWSVDDATDSATLSVPYWYAVNKELDFWCQWMATLTAPTIELYFGTINLGGSFLTYEIDSTRNTLRGLKVNMNALSYRSIGSSVLSAQSMYLTTSPQAVDPISNNPLPPSWAGLYLQGNRAVLSAYLGDLGDPIVRLSDLARVVRQIKAQFDTHVHKGVKNGPGITGLPIARMITVSTGSSQARAESVTKQAALTSI